MFNKVSARTSFTTIPPLWWPTTVTAKPKTSRQKQNTSRQNQKPHGKNKIPQGKTKNLTAKTKISRLNQNLHGKNKIPHGKTKYFTAKTKYIVYLVLPWVFAFAVRYLVFAVKYLVFAVRFLFLPWSWGFRFCREVFCFCRVVRFLVLPWQLLATVNDIVPRTRKLWMLVMWLTCHFYGGWEVAVTDPQTDSQESTNTKI